MNKRLLNSDDSGDSDDSDSTSKKTKTGASDHEEDILVICREFLPECFPEKTLRQIIAHQLKCEDIIPVGMGGIIGLRVKAEIGKRTHEKVNQIGTPCKVNTYTSEEQEILIKHVKIRAAEVVAEKMKEELQRIGKTTYESFFTRKRLFCDDKNAVRLNDNATTRKFVFPLLLLKPNNCKRERPKQAVKYEKLKDQMLNDIVEMLKACYGFISDWTVDVDQYNIFLFNAGSEGILDQLLFILSSVLKYRGKTIDEIFEEVNLPPIVDSDLYKKFTAKEKADKNWPKRFNTFQVNGGGTRSGSTPIYYGIHLKNKREEVQKYKESLSG